MYSKKEMSILKKDFWESFHRYTSYFSIKTGEPVKWMYYKTGVSGLELKFDIDKSRCRVVLEVNSRNEARRHTIWEDLEKYKAIIEDQIENLVWEPNFILDEGKQVSCIYIEYTSKSYYNKENWPDIFIFMADNMYQLQQNLLLILDVFQEKYGK